MGYGRLQPLAIAVPSPSTFSPRKEVQANLGEIIMGTAFNLSLYIRKVNHVYCLVLFINNSLLPQTSQLDCTLGLKITVGCKLLL